MRSVKGPFNSSKLVILVALQKDTQQELLRARSLLGTRDDGYRRAQESFIRTESTGPAVGAEVVRRRKELERRRKNEEEAFTKVNTYISFVLFVAILPNQASVPSPLSTL